MANNQKIILISTFIGLAAVTIIGFQNCSRTYSVLDSSGGAAFTSPQESMTDGSPSAASLPPNLGAPQTPYSTTAPGGTPDTGTVGQAGQGGEGELECPPQELVECQMGSPNEKIILDGRLKVDYANASASRVCMSSNACLHLINAYAVARNCLLSGGAAPAPQENMPSQCTEIFPGSQGTCHHAESLTDAEVNDLLAQLGAAADSSQ